MLGFFLQLLLSSKLWYGVCSCPYCYIDVEQLVDIRLGFPFSFGVFEAYYSTHEPFSENTSGIAAIGTSATVSMLIMSYFKSQC